MLLNGRDVLRRPIRKLPHSLSGTGDGEVEMFRPLQKRWKYDSGDVPRAGSDGPD